MNTITMMKESEAMVKKKEICLKIRAVRKLPDVSSHASSVKDFSKQRVR